MKTLECQALESELAETQALVKGKDEELRRIYDQLAQKQADPGRDSQNHNVCDALKIREVEFGKLLETIERKTGEIIELKTQLHKATTELDKVVRLKQTN